MFPPKKKKLGESVGFGGESSAPPRYSAGGSSGSSSKPSAPAIDSDTSAENNAQEKPADEQAFHAGGDAGSAGGNGGSSAPTATPESVNYRTEAETCQNCEYMQGADCTFLKQPVAAGDSCNRFENKGEDMAADGGQDMDMDASMGGSPSSDLSTGRY